MEWYQAVVLAIVQGVTEFLPISSSAHLALAPLLLGWPDQGLAFDVAVHVGSLSAVVFYYRQDLQHMTRSWLRSLVVGESDSNSQLVWYLAAATVPVAVTGLLANELIENELRSVAVIATTTLVFGVLLGWADRRAERQVKPIVLSLSIALLIGLAQAVAPIPGVSRSGVTITAALLLGVDRQTAARFSFLLSIPVIAIAGALMAVDLYLATAAVEWLPLLIAAAVSGIAAYLSIAAFLRLLDSVGLMPFVYYRIFLAGVLYLLILT